MAVRGDITIDWALSPRVITVAAPSTEVSMQDLVDTLRTLEDDIANLDDKKILDAAGKTQIRAGVYSSITVTLQNAVLAFEARGGPDWVLCSLVGGNITAVDAGGSPIDPRKPTAYVSCDRAASTEAALIDGAAQDVADAVWDEAYAGHIAPGATGRLLLDTYGTAVDTFNLAADITDLVDDLHDEALGKWVLNPKTSTLTLYRSDGSVLQVFTLKTAVGDVPPYVERTPQP